MVLFVRAVCCAVLCCSDVTISYAISIFQNHIKILVQWYMYIVELVFLKNRYSIRYGHITTGQF